MRFFTLFLIIEIDQIYSCKFQYNNVGFLLNNHVGKPTFLFSHSPSSKY